MKTFNGKLKISRLITRIYGGRVEQIIYND